MLATQMKTRNRMIEIKSLIVVADVYERKKNYSRDIVEVFLEFRYSISNSGAPFSEQQSK